MLVSVVIEWENVLLAEMDRCRRMLETLRRQMVELTARGPDQRFEILVVYDRELVEGALVVNELKRVFPGSDPRIRADALPATGLHYYQLKNFGARQAGGELILFLDSDVIPDPQWLEKLTGCFDRADVEVAGGGTYVDPAGLLGKAAALTWIFPLRTAGADVVESFHFYANNVAFRRATFARYPFPHLGQTDRGACIRLASVLRENGVAIYRHGGAWVNHPAPNGFRHLFMRAVVHGRDELLGRREVRGRPPFVRESARQFRCFAKDLARSLRSIAGQRREVGLSLFQAPLAFAVALFYYQSRLAAALATQVHPRFMREHFQI